MTDEMPSANDRMRGLHASEYAGEFTKKIRTVVNTIHAKGNNTIGTSCILHACKIIDKLEEKRLNEQSAKIEAENECCVLRGEINRLQAELEKYKLVEQILQGAIPEFIAENFTLRGDKE